MQNKDRYLSFAKLALSGLTDPVFRSANDSNQAIFEVPLQFFQ